MAKNRALAIDIGATNLRIASVSAAGKILVAKKSKTPSNIKSEKEFIEKVAKTISDFIFENKISNIKTIGVSVAGALNKKEKTAMLINISCEKIHFGLLEKKLGVKINLINDCGAAVLAEGAFGKHNTDNLTYLTISSGIGGGVISEGKLIEGVDGNAAEIGHFTVKSKYDLSCGCGGINHWEAYASGIGIPKFFKAWAKDLNLSVNLNNYNNSKKIFDLAESGNKIALNFIHELGKINGQGISNVIFAYNPEVIILGGGIGLNRQNLIKDNIIKNIDKYIRVPKIKITKLGDEITLLGAAYTVFKNQSD